MGMGADGHLSIAAGAWGERQLTLKNPIHCSGVGVHNGRKVHMTLRPAAADHGIVFRRSDLGESVPAHWSKAVESPLCTTLVLPSGAKLATVEHLMSAFLGLGIDNALVELDGPEVPIMDGSAAPFVFLIECAGIEEQAAPRHRIEVLKPVAVEEKDRSARLAPADRMAVDFSIEFPNALIQRQRWQGLVTAPAYKREIARARTFGFLQEVESLRARGLALGGSLENAIVIDGTRVMNEGGLRFADEFVRHKVLDAIGDLYLAGAPLVGRFTGERAGHALTLRLLRELFADRTAWRWVTAEEMPHAAALPRAERAVAQRA
jgi:UDP-3-O-[3-hydroxymyristoyl] N-acetylglucosamine deacetylase